jgi:hypothetical protein
VQFLDDPLDPMCLPFGHDDLGAVFAQMQCHPPSDALPRTSDEHDFPVNVPHGPQSDTGVSFGPNGRLSGRS